MILHKRRKRRRSSSNARSMHAARLHSLISKRQRGQPAAYNCRSRVIRANAAINIHLHLRNTVLHLLSATTAVVFTTKTSRHRRLPPIAIEFYSARRSADRCRNTHKTLAPRPHLSNISITIRPAGRLSLLFTHRPRRDRNRHRRHVRNTVFHTLIRVTAVISTS